MSDRPDHTILLNRVRANYLFAYEPFKGKNDAGQDTATYCAHGIMPLTHPDIPKLVALMKRVAIDAKGNEADGLKLYEQLKAQDRLCIHFGNVNKPDRPEYKDMLYVSANGKKRPRILGRHREALQASDGKPYSGAWVNLHIDVWYQDGRKGGGQRINAQFMGVQHWEDDERFGGGGRISEPEEFPQADDADQAAPAVAGANNDLLG
jgi:hypothetical protein